ncbi:short-chain dehydrogenase/reductase family 42E member 1-like [Oscarella lobularis]|uniref:short-chain dehydrogenase/reductase family 42E member 1-like n=1 Tax=Oscarella lobularis TaxID=121494 RepID=UPI00331412AA
MAQVMLHSKYLVIGGGGYLGYRLGLLLLKTGETVTLFDVKEPDDLNPKFQFIEGDVSLEEDVAKACSHAHHVFLVASYGMSGREQLNRRRIEAVNVQGTVNVINACRENSVKSLIYTSTTNVVFCGQPIINGNESLPYVPDSKHVDHYSRTKCIAEKLVLKANGTTGRRFVLHTCALRPAGIYGEGERRHLPRVVRNLERGLFAFTHGSDDSLVEFVHVDNLAQAHVLAAKALDENPSTVGGQPYFISDGCPVNNFEFFRPLIEGLGFKYPTIKLPLHLVYFFAFLTEMVHAVLSRCGYNFQPLLTRAEVYKTGVTHYFSIDKAKRELGYKPEHHSLEGVVEYFRTKGHGHTKKRRGGGAMFWLVNIALALIAVLVLLSYLPLAK